MKCSCGGEYRCERCGGKVRQEYRCERCGGKVRQYEQC